MAYRDYKMRGAIREHLRSRSDNLSLAITLTMRQAIRYPDGSYENLTPEKVSVCANHFLRKLNLKIFGSAFKRYQKRLDVVTVIEGGGETWKHLHLHLALQFPPWLDRFSADDQYRFEKMVRKCWASTKWADIEVDYQQCTDVHGWINYITKGGYEAVDAANTYLA